MLQKIGATARHQPIIYRTTFKIRLPSSKSSRSRVRTPGKPLGYVSLRGGCHVTEKVECEGADRANLFALSDIQ